MSNWGRFCEALERNDDDGAFQIAIKFGEQNAWIEAEERIEKAEETARAARAVALAATKWLASDADEDYYGEFAAAVEEWERAFVAGEE